MAIEGPLRELGIHDVFQLLDLSRKTGVLRVTSELRDDQGVVHFESGRVVHASIRSKPVPLELALLHAGKITEDDLQVAYAARDAGTAGRNGGASGARSSSPDVVDALLRGGAITPRELERWLRLQIESVVFELMSWRDGFFSFEERSALDVRRDARISVSTESLLMEGARRIDEWSRIAHRIPSLGVIPVLAPISDAAAGAQLDLLPGEWEVLGMIDGVRDLRAIAAALGTSDFEVAKVTYGLVTTGVVEIRQPERASVVTMAAMEGREAVLARGNAAYQREAFDEALAAARAILASGAEDPEARVLAARVLGRLGRHAEAVEELKRALREWPVDGGAPDGREHAVLVPRSSLQAALGFAAVQVGDFATARASWESFLREAPSDPEADRVQAALATMRQLEALIERHAHG